MLQTPLGKEPLRHTPAIGPDLPETTGLLERRYQGATDLTAIGTP
jgi:hypothetical protein